jgi:hypothetical protein
MTPEHKQRLVRNAQQLLASNAAAPTGRTLELLDAGLPARGAERPLLTSEDEEIVDRVPRGRR